MKGEKKKAFVFNMIQQWHVLAVKNEVDSLCCDIPREQNVYAYLEGADLKNNSCHSFDVALSSAV